MLLVRRVPGVNVCDGMLGISLHLWVSFYGIIKLDFEVELSQEPQLSHEKFFSELLDYS